MKESRNYEKFKVAVNISEHLDGNRIVSID